MQWIFIHPCGIPQNEMTSLLDTSAKDPLHSHCYQVNDCQKNNFVNKRGWHFCTEENAILLLVAT